MNKLTLMSMALPMKFTILLAILVCTMTVSYAQSQKKDLLIGRWVSERLEYSKEIAKQISADEIQQMNSITKGLVIMTFTADNKCSSEQKKRGVIKKSKGIYELLPNSELIYIDDRAKIVQLDKTYLKLYKNDLTPIVVYKRIEK